MGLFPSASYVDFVSFSSEDGRFSSSDIVVDRGNSHVSGASSELLCNIKDAV